MGDATGRNIGCQQQIRAQEPCSGTMPHEAIDNYGDLAGSYHDQQAAYDLKPPVQRSPLVDLPSWRKAGDTEKLSE